MIVIQAVESWEIIFQPAHGLLAHQLAEQFSESMRSRYWPETKAAILIHDDAKEEMASRTSQYLTPLGAPRNFSDIEMTAVQRFEESKRKLNAAYRKHSWIGLLNSLHLQTLYGSEEVSDDLVELLNTEKVRRRKTLRHLSAKMSELAEAYSLMRWCDRCSLILCQDQLPAMQRKLEIITTNDHGQFLIWKTEDENVSVDPWPFASTEFQISVEVHRINQLQFDSENEFADVLSKSLPDTLSWKLAK